MKNIFIILFVISCFTAKTQQETPRLVVGIVVDQMRYNYISKYWHKFEENGFKRLVNEGYNCKNTHYNYVPTYTGPGHASIYSGTTPATHGIISNNWYVKTTKETVYCVDDANYKIVGGEGIGKSSDRLLTTNISDELRLSNNQRSKVISISLKDRGAILPAGHLANGAFWFDGTTGNWVSSTKFMTQLPKWVVEFNKKERAKEFLSKPWSTLLDIDAYQESSQDNNVYESPFTGEEQPTFPHDLPKIFKETKRYDIIKYTPFGNTLTRELAEIAIEAEGLGNDDYPDLLAVSFSATDYVGHKFGPQSMELEDVYLRLDKDIAKLLKTLDEKVGKGNYTLFLTADHGAVRNPQYLIDNKIPAGYFDETNLIENANKYISNYLGEGEWVVAFSNYQFFLDETLITSKKLTKNRVEDIAVEFAMTVKGIAKAYTSVELKNTSGDKFLSLQQKGYHQKISGNVAVALFPGWITYSKTGTTHGSSYGYDTHVPLLWLGKNIPQGKSTSREMYITDIAPTIATFLNISFPNGTIGKPILEVVE